MRAPATLLATAGVNAAAEDASEAFARLRLLERISRRESSTGRPFAAMFTPKK
ncbi:MAG TPA: hypothetical protein VG454_10305 [Gemmatimonadales bacterium]|nr:hypothetical protein [Gemmatimonadales bacterium]